jgi:hypothetical protein
MTVPKMRPALHPVAEDLETYERKTYAYQRSRPYYQCTALPTHGANGATDVYIMSSRARAIITRNAAEIFVKEGRSRRAFVSVLFRFHACMRTFGQRDKMDIEPRSAQPGGLNGRGGRQITGQ